MYIIESFVLAAQARVNRDLYSFIGFRFNTHEHHLLVVHIRLIMD